MVWQAALAGAAGLGAFAQQGQRNRNAREATRYARQEQDTLHPYWSRNLNNLEGAYNSPYEQYGGQRIQGANPYEQQAAQGYFGQGQAFNNAAGGLANRIGQINSQPNHQQLDPYIQNYNANATDRTVDRLYEGAGQRSTALGAQAGRGGNFGGSRHAFLTSLQDRELTNTEGDLRAQGNLAGYQLGLQSLQQDKQNVNYGLGTLGNHLGAQGNYAQTLSGFGQNFRGIDQANRDTQYNYFTEGRDWQRNQLGAYHGLLNQRPNFSATNPTDYANPFGAGAAAGAQTYGAALDIGRDRR